MKTIEIVSIPVSDQQRAKAFYSKLGFQIVVESSMGNGQTWIQMGLPNQTTCISLITWWPKKEGGPTTGLLHGVVFETEEIEMEVEALKEKGIEFKKIDETPWGKFAQFSDPDGNGLTLHQK